MSGTDHIEQLERLQRLKESGTIDQEEFEREKQRILSDEPEVSASNTGRNLAIAGVLAVAAVGIGVLISRPMQQTVANGPAGKATAAAAIQPSASASPLVELAPAAKLAAAFKAATGRTAAHAARIDGQPAKIVPLRVLDLPFGPVLLVSATLADGCHACSGAIGVYYLRQEGAAFTVVKKWPEAVKGWGWGAPPSDWSVTDKFTRFPAIYAEGGYTGQGITCDSATLTELRPEGPVLSDRIKLSFSNAGNVDAETGMTFTGDPALDLSGEIVNVAKDKSFEVRVSGDESFSERYVMRGGKFVPEAESSRLSC